MGHCITQNRLCLVDVIGDAGANAVADEEIRVAAGRTPNDSVMCARLPLANTRPSAISAESAIMVWAIVGARQVKFLSGPAVGQSQDALA